MAKKNMLKDMEISSTDLCKRGANQYADIKLFKSADAGKGGETEHMEGNNTVVEKIARFLAGIVAEESAGTITKAVSTAQVRETTEALCKSLESIIADDSLTAVEKHEMMADSLQAFTLEATDCMESWSHAIGKADDEDLEDGEEEPEEDDFDDDEEEEEETEEPGEEPEEKNVAKGVFDMNTIDITKMSPEDQAALNALIAKYETEETPAPQEMHPDVKKALDEVAEMRKSMEMQEMTSIAKKYEILGKKADELGAKLYELKKAGDSIYNDYVAVLDEQVRMQETSGVFKEFGSSRAGAPSDLDGMVMELRKADPSLTREEAICKAFETNPNLDPFTGKLR